MPIYNKDSRLYEPILQDPTLIQVIGRFGIHLGVGDATIREICHAHKLDADFFLAIVNTYVNPDYFPEKIVGRAYVSLLVDYLRQADSHYTDVLIPNIDRHFALLMRNSADDDSVAVSNLPMLMRFYQEVRGEIISSVENDTVNLFPELLKEGTKLSAAEHLTTNRTLEDKVGDLASFFVIHLKGNHDSNLCVAVVTAISTLAKDMQQNNRIRERILMPLCQG